MSDNNKQSVELYHVLQVMLGLPASGEICGWATTDFCKAAAIITKEDGIELKEGRAGAVLDAIKKTNEIVSTDYSDLYSAVESELRPIFEQEQIKAKAAELVSGWASENSKKFGPSLAF